MPQEEEQTRIERCVPPILEVEDAPPQLADSLPALVEDLSIPPTIKRARRAKKHIKSHWSKNPPKLIPTINDHSQLWSTHDKVSRAFARNSELVEGWNKSLDVLLVFAGLFSAINTAFIMESYKDLQPNPADITNDLLRILISHNLNNLTISPEESRPRSRNSAAVHINSIFFFSLSLSLSAAFGAVTVRQWLTEYSNDGAIIAPHMKGRRRQARYQGLKTWNLQLVIEFLPMLLQFSLLLFLIGVVDFLWEWDRKVATLQLFLLCAGLTVYGVTVVIGIGVPSSPFQTPVTRYVSRHYYEISPALGSVLNNFKKGINIKRVLDHTYQAQRRGQESSKSEYSGRNAGSRLPAVNAIVPYRKDERSRWDSALITAAEAVVWLLEHADHPDVTITALDAVRRLPPSLALSLIREREGLLETLIAFHHSLLPLASSTDTQADWLVAWPDAAVVSALAWQHILWADSLEHDDRLAMKLRLTESDPYGDANVWEVLENNSDIRLTAQCLLKLGFNKSHSSYVGDLLMQCMKRFPGLDQRSLCDIVFPIPADFGCNNDPPINTRHLADFHVCTKFFSPTSCISST
ncbi:hypothetical protein FRC03_006421 [Tulasnella sp. 419]|nr:hypothetical protein FRC03_006421 [Tulasnella sp. 419]